VKAPPRCPEMNPEEQSLGGDRAPQELNTPTAAADRHPDQGPEGEVGRAGAVTATWRQAKPVNDTRARAADEAVRLGGGNKPLKGESRTWLWGETNPRGRGESKPSRVCETPGAERRVGLGCPLASGSPRLISRLGTEPQGRRSSHPCAGQVRSGQYSEEEAKLTRG
jgi:hypothetical protein